MVANHYRKGDYNPYLFTSDDFGQTWTRRVDATEVEGYALSFVQDPVEPRLLFLGTENGLWVSVDAGEAWHRFGNGFPSVSTMDLHIQEKESALVVGTFGRAIWVLDDLRSLREIAADRLKPGITALPMNDAVQVKGLFIAPPGNIWTGFHTTFEGENRVFQKMQIPFYVQGTPGGKDTVRATVYNEKNEAIQHLHATGLLPGLNYLTWKLDEAGAPIPPAWMGEDERGIPVLPGRYPVVLEYRSFKDTSFVTVVSDPRFNTLQEADAPLYALRKAVHEQAAKLFSLLRQIDQRVAATEKIEAHFARKTSEPDKNHLRTAADIKAQLSALRLKGQPRPVNRQVGAWQSTAVSPYSKVEEMVMIAAARTVPPSPQEWERLETAKALVEAYTADVHAFLSGPWKRFEDTFRSIQATWFEGVQAPR
jgi:hypothetical protein